MPRVNLNETDSIWASKAIEMTMINGSVKAHIAFDEADVEGSPWWLTVTGDGQEAITRHTSLLSAMETLQKRILRCEY